MKLYMKQKVFSFRDSFTVYDENGEPKYTVKGEIISFGKKLHVFDRSGREIIFIAQRLLTFLPRYTVQINGVAEFEIKKEFSFIKPYYTIAENDIEIRGEFLSHEFEIIRAGGVIATLRKEWFTWGDSYALEILSPAYELTALAAVLVIDCVDAANTAAN